MPPEEGRSEPAPAERRSPAGIALLGTALGVVLSFLTSLLASTGGRFVPQVVDLYVVCQYARALAEGHPFRYNPGESPSTGSTSLLHTVLLAAAHALGFRGEALVAFAILAGAAFYGASVLLARRVGEALGDRDTGLLAGFLVALGGPVVWGYLYGSDIALAMFLALLVLERWLAWWSTGSVTGLAVALSLLALARPEGLVISALLALVAFRHAVTGGRRPPLALLAPVAAAFLVLALNRGMTGSWLGTSVADKSLFANYGVRDALGLVAEYGIDVVRGLLLGFYPSDTPIGFARGWAPYYFPPLALAFVLMAALRAPGALRGAVGSWLVVVGVTFALVAGNTFMGVHFNRYLMWAFPGLLALTAAGLRPAAALVAPEEARGTFRALAGLFLLLGLLSTVRFAVAYGQTAGVVARRDLALAEWIRKELPPGVAMANLGTSVEYLTGHRNLNLHGVTTPAFFGGRTAEREAAMFEALSRLPAADRPPYLITSAALQEGSPLLRELVAGPPLFQTTSFTDELQVFPMRYDLVGKAERPFAPGTGQAVAGLHEVDRLNVGDGEDERRHGYRFRSRLGDVPLFGAVRIDAYDLEGGREVVADAGRAILGEETFRVAAARGRDLVVVMRTASGAEVAVRQASLTGLRTLDIPEAGFLVRRGDEVLARVVFRPHPGWNETMFRISGDKLGEAATELTLTGRYASFHYWFYQ